jgi:hypothetical protein
MGIGSFFPVVRIKEERFTIERKYREKLQLES